MRRRSLPIMLRPRHRRWMPSKMPVRVSPGGGPMTKLEECLRVFLSLSLCLLLLFDCGVLFWLFTAPYWEQVPYDDFNRGDIHWNRVAGYLTQDCKQLDRSSDPGVIRDLDQDIVTLTTRVDLSAVGMPLSTRMCVINVIHEEGKKNE